MLDALKRSLKELIGRELHDEAFRRLKEEVLDSGSALYNDTITVQARFHGADRAGKLGLIDFGERSRSFNNVNDALLWLIDRISIADLSARLRRQQETHRAIAPEHALTCDRTGQSDQFELDVYDPPQPGRQVHFYFLYGDARQEHESLFQRLGLELGGFLLNWEQGEYDPGVRLYPVAFKPRVHRIPKLFKINILRELLSRFFEPMNAQQPVEGKTICDLLKSPKLQGFGPQDLVFILITLDDYNWHDKLIPALVRDFHDGFCQGELGEGAPRFFFFFGIEYQKDNQPVRKQVHKAMKESRHGLTLPELTPIAVADLEEWLSRYRLLLENSGREAGELARQLFPGQSAIDMADAERKLKELIDRHNKGLVLNDKSL